MRLGGPREFESGEFTKNNVDGIVIYEHSTIKDLDSSIQLGIDINKNTLTKSLGIYGMPAEQPGRCG